jgi:hypothetical protein
MRLLILAASALAFAACSPSAPATDAAKPAADAAKPASDATASHDMSTMSADMKSADTKDDANTAETPDGYTFHTYPAKVESVHLPTATGDTWTATASDTVHIEVGEAKDEKMPDGAMHHVVKVTPKAAGNATVKFERHKGGAPAVTETRTINFMVH